MNVAAVNESRAFTPQQFHAARKFVDTDFGRIAYVEAGTGPVALFIHGAVLNGYQWRHQLAGLADVRRVIAVDSLAMGHTEMKPGLPLGMKHQAAMIASFLAALGIDRVDLVGNDSGGGAAQIFAARHPQAIRTLTLTNCEVHDYDENNPASLQLRQMIESGVMVKTLRAAAGAPALGKVALSNVYQDAKALPDDAVVTYVTPLVQSQARIDQMLGYFAATTNRDLIEVEPQLRALPAPVMVLWGTADAFFPLKWAYWLKDNLPNVVEVVELEGAPVFWPEERPDFLNRKLREFWTSH
jgi:pimeloyl-ACP methyl ester carboxylesterase